MWWLRKTCLSPLLGYSSHLHLSVSEPIRKLLQGLAANSSNRLLLWELLLAEQELSHPWRRHPFSANDGLVKGYRRRPPYFKVEYTLMCGWHPFFSKHSQCSWTRLETTSIRKFCFPVQVGWPKNFCRWHAFSDLNHRMMETFTNTSS